jgi:hypothetical protein
VLGLFSNFSVAFTYLSPIVGVFSLFTIGLGIAGPGYIWTPLAPGRRHAAGGARLRRAGQSPRSTPGWSCTSPR